MSLRLRQTEDTASDKIAVLADGLPHLLPSMALAALRLDREYSDQVLLLFRLSVF